LTVGMVRRAGFLATLAAAVGLLGASFHGMTSVDRELKIAAAPTPQPELVQEQWHVRDCDRDKRERHHPEV
jgi:hypothetical protein